MLSVTVTSLSKLTFRITAQSSTLLFVSLTCITVSIKPTSAPKSESMQKLVDKHIHLVIRIILKQTTTLYNCSWSEEENCVLEERCILELSCSMNFALNPLTKLSLRDQSKVNSCIKAWLHWRLPTHDCPTTPQLPWNAHYCSELPTTVFQDKFLAS